MTCSMMLGVLLFAWCYSMSGLFVRRMIAPRSVPLRRHDHWPRAAGHGWHAAAASGLFDSMDRTGNSSRCRSAS